MQKPTPETVVSTLAERGSIRKTATALGVPRSSLQDWIAEWSEQDPAFAARLTNARTQRPSGASAPQRAGITLKGGEATVYGDPLPADRLDTRNAERYLRDRWGLPEDEWLMVTVSPNEWQGPIAGGGTQTFAQVKGTFRKRADLHLLTPAAEVTRVPRVPARRSSRGEPTLTAVMSDPQVPYHDPALTAAMLSMLEDVQPQNVDILGDVGDYPTISRHADHPAAAATPQECIDGSHAWLRDIREVARKARMRKIRGNHDWRLEGELLARAERLAYIRPAGEDVSAMSLRRLLQLDALDIEYHADPRGWEHDELEIVPGPHGLVARHGWMTGTNNAERSLLKRGRSIIFGHVHTRQHVFRWDPSAGVERQAMSLATMSHARNVVFPHFAVCDDWLQGYGMVTAWPSGEFVMEHVRWNGSALYWRDRAWRP